jgi:DNA repair photolyase
VPPIRLAQARSILSPVSGFLAEAGFTHSLTPARNCTFGCTYCYVPTMRVQAGLQPEDWRHWGQFTTFKTNAAELLRRELPRKPGAAIYCSPLVDPYQPAEADQLLMPEILQAVIDHPPRIFVLQTRGTLILRDLDLLRAAGSLLRVSFSITTDRDDVRRLYEPHCAPVGDRFSTIRKLRAAGIDVFVTLAPLLPCNPENLARLAIEASGRDLIGDPLHERATKPRGATTRDAALRISVANRFEQWHEPAFQTEMVDRVRAAARSLGHQFRVGPAGFGTLAA